LIPVSLTPLDRVFYSPEDVEDLEVTAIRTNVTPHIVRTDLLSSHMVLGGQMGLDDVWGHNVSSKEGRLKATELGNMANAV